MIERADDPQRFADMVNPQDNLIPKLGILGIEINDKVAQLLPTLRHEYGIVVAARASTLPYSGADLEPGDVIYEINRTPTITIKTLRDILDCDETGRGGGAPDRAQREAHVHRSGIGVTMRFWATGVASYRRG